MSVERQSVTAAEYAYYLNTAKTLRSQAISRLAKQLFRLPNRAWERIRLYRSSMGVPARTALATAPK